ncbi:MAG: hypothetical protein Q4G67_10385 [Actinomycetia bacterium]|nr:hypothetical protein [Actinomycetes bacterium]
MLSIVPIPGAGPETVARLAEAARQTEGPLTTGGETVTIRSQNWSLSRTEVDGEFDPSLTVISPEVHTLTFFPDGSMRQEITAGYPYDASGSKVPSTTTPPGSVIDVFTFGPGENQPFFAGPAPTDPDQVGPFLTEGGGLDLNRSAANRFLAIGYLLSEQRLDHQQLAALLVYLARTGGYEVKGTTTDRLGRPALVVTAQAEGDQMEFSLLLDPTIGTILATETVYIGDTDPTLTAPTVTHYGAWENSE